MTIDCETEQPNELRQVLHVRSHTFHADALAASGGADAAPGPHDYFDAALAACKAITVSMFAKRHGMALERVETHVERDDSEERKGKYVLRVRLAFHGNLTGEERARLYDIASRCPVHKLMTTTDIVIETATIDIP